MKRKVSIWISMAVIVTAVTLFGGCQQGKKTDNGGGNTEASVLKIMFASEITCKKGPSTITSNTEVKDGDVLDFTATVPGGKAVDTWKVKGLAVPGANKETFKYTVKKSDAQDGIILVSVDFAEASLPALAAPANVKAAATENAGELKITWDNVDNNNGYTLSYKKTADSEFSTVDIAKDVVVRILSGLEDAEYEVTVKAKGDGSAYSDSPASSVVTATPKAENMSAPQLEAPSNVKAAATENAGELKITWDNVANNIGYILSYKKTADTVFSTVDIAKDGVAHILTGLENSEYSITVKAKGDGENYRTSKASAEVKATPKEGFTVNFGSETTCEKNGAAFTSGSKVVAGDVLKFTAVIPLKHKVKVWKVKDNEVVGETAKIFNYTVKTDDAVDGVISVSVEFEEDKGGHKIIFGEGITCANGSVSVESGDKISENTELTFTFNKDAAYKIVKNWRVNNIDRSEAVNSVFSYTVNSEDDKDADSDGELDGITIGVLEQEAAKILFEESKITCFIGDGFGKDISKVTPGKLIPKTAYINLYYNEEEVPAGQTVKNWKDGDTVISGSNRLILRNHKVSSIAGDDHTFTVEFEAISDVTVYFETGTGYGSNPDKKITATIPDGSGGTKPVTSRTKVPVGTEITFTAAGTTITAGTTEVNKWFVEGKKNVEQTDGVNGNQFTYTVSAAGAGLDQLGNYAIQVSYTLKAKTGPYYIVKYDESSVLVRAFKKTASGYDYNSLTLRNGDMIPADYVTGKLSFAYDDVRETVFEKWQINGEDMNPLASYYPNDWAIDDTKATGSGDEKVYEITAVIRTAKQYTIDIDSSVMEAKLNGKTLTDLNNGDAIYEEDEVLFIPKLAADKCVDVWTVNDTDSEHKGNILVAGIGDELIPSPNTVLKVRHTEKTAGMYTIKFAAPIECYNLSGTPLNTDTQVKEGDLCIFKYKGKYGYSSAKWSMNDIKINESHGMHMSLQQLLYYVNCPVGGSEIPPQDLGSGVMGFEITATGF